MGLKADIEQLKNKSKTDYSEYRQNLSIIVKEYNDCCSEFDVLIGTINAERLSFRKEIRVLYNFLQDIGGKLKEGKHISVFDFADEAPAPNQSYSEIIALSEPDFKNIDGWDWFWKGGLVLTIDHFKNKETYQKFLLAVEEKSNEYQKDLGDRTTQIAYMKDAIEMAKLYRNIIVIVRDTVIEKIIPELNLIQAFLYADAIRELVLDGEKPEYVEACAISEYKGTKYDVHYQFVKNTFDFYNISTTFFKQTVLTNILRDRVVTDSEKNDFTKQVNEIRQQIATIESKKVI